MVSGSATSPMISVSWTAVNSTTRSNEMPYSNMTVNGGDTTSSDITGLDLSTQYSVRIASVNELGTGNYSGIVSATTYGCRFNRVIYCVLYIPHTHAH